MMRLFFAAVVVASPVFADDVQNLADRQGTNHQHTVVAQRRAEALGKRAEIVVEIDRAAGHMSDAAQKLMAAKRGEASAPATAAIQNLDKAIKLLERQIAAVNTADMERLRRELAKRYQEIKAKQLEINAVTTRSLERLDDRRTLLQLSRVGREQKELAAELETLAEHKALRESAVVTAINEDIAANMNRSRQGLEQASITARVTRAQEAIIARIDEIIEALEDNKGRGDEFATPPTNKIPSSEDPCIACPPRAIPHLAELKLLRALQMAINSETKSLHEEKATPGQIRELADQQARVEALSKTKLLDR